MSAARRAIIESAPDHLKRFRHSMTRCFVCKGPFHPATGGLHDNGLGGLTPFCGPCERDLVEWRSRQVAQRKRRVKVDGKTVVLKFYDYATFPPAKP